MKRKTLKRAQFPGTYEVQFGRTSLLIMKRLVIDSLVLLGWLIRMTSLRILGVFGRR